MAKQLGFWYVSPEKRAQAKAGMAARRHGPSVVYAEGKPIVLQTLAKEIGCTVRQLTERVRRHREAGKPITEAALRQPFKAPATRTPAAQEPLRRRLRLD